MAVTPCPYPQCRDVAGDAALTSAGICERCRVRVERDLRTVPYLYVALHLELPPGRGATSDKVSGTRSPAVPLRLSLLEAGSALADIVNDWTDLVRRHAGFPPDRGGAKREAWRVERGVSVLLPRVDQACLLAAESAVALSTATLTARHLLGITRLVHRLAVPCPDCDLLALVREDGSTYVRCRNCGARWSEELYQSLARVIAAEYDASL